MNPLEMVKQLTTGYGGLTNSSAKPNNGPGGGPKLTKNTYTDSSTRRVKSIGDVEVKYIGRREVWNGPAGRVKSIGGLEIEYVRQGESWRGPVGGILSITGTVQ